MFRGCVFCKMKEAIFGCIGGRTDRPEDLPTRGNNSCDSHEQTRLKSSYIGFDYNGEGDEIGFRDLSSQRNQRRSRNGQTKIKRQARYFELDPLEQQQELVRHAKSYESTTQEQQSTSPRNQFELKGSSIPSQIPKKASKITDDDLIEDSRAYDQSRLSNIHETRRLGQGQGRPRSLLPRKRTSQQGQSKLYLPQPSTQPSTSHANTSRLYSPKPSTFQERGSFLHSSPKASTSRETPSRLCFPVQHTGPKKPARLIPPKQGARACPNSQTKLTRTNPRTSEFRKVQEPVYRVGTRLESSSPSSQESSQLHDSCSQRQYERDLQRRYFERRPIAEFLYSDSRPVRGILKQPKFMEHPDIDLYEMFKETERSKEAFMDMLATRYPQYAEKISSTASEDGFPVRGRSRDPRRRATTVVYPSQQNRSTDYDDIGTMSEVDAPTFQRGGYVRSSLPARSPQPFIDKPMGLVFLVYGDETKKALLPNEITHLDTVRALFVRSFPGKLTMEYLDSPKNKIYILDPRTNIYYQLEDLKDIKDRTVLKIHKCDSTEPQKTFDKPEVRGRTIQTPTLPLEYHGISTPATAITGQVQKAKTLPASMHPPYFIYEEAPPPKPGYERSRSLTPDPSHVSYAQNPIYGRMGVSPERTSSAPERQGLRTIPENLQMINGYPAQNNYVNDVDLYQQAPGGPQGPRRGTGQSQYPQHAKSASPSHHGNQQAPPSRRAFSPLPSSSQYDYIQVVPAQSAPPGAPPNMYIAKGVPASTVISPQRATGPRSTPVPQQQPNWRERSPVGRHSHNFATVPVSIESTNGIQRSQSYRVTPDRETYASLPPRSTTPQPVDNNTRVRINKMEAQLAHLAAWVQSAVHSTGSTGALSSTRSTASTASIGSENTSPLVDSASSSLTDLGSEETITQDMKTNILAIKNQADRLRLDLKNLRRLQQINKESIIETVEEAWKKIKKALAAVPGAEQAIIRQERASLDEIYQLYIEEKNHAERELVDLEASVEELRNDVLSRQCRVNMSDVEGMALILSHVAKKVGELKNRFPTLQERMKQIMAGEMEIVVKEEKFLKEEPEKLENCLKRCKRLTGTLFTLKRLASVQEHRPAQTVSIPLKGNIPSEDDKKTLLENIQALIPNHDVRLQSLQAADASRQRKKKILTQQEALRFGKSLEMASKALKPAISTATSTLTSTGMITSSPNYSSQGIKVTASATVVTSESSSIISFSNPISTSTPKAAPQAFSMPVSSASSTSPSKPYPIVSLIRAVSPRREVKRSSFPLTENVEKMSSSVKPKEISDSSSKSQTYASKAKMSLQTTTTDGFSEPSNEISEDTNYSAQFLNTKKNMARAAFFSSLASSHPSSTSPSNTARDVLMSVSPSTSPEGKIGFSSEISPISPSKTDFSQISSLTKPSDLKVTASSSISFHTKPSPTSPTEAKPRSGFTGIPKPTTPTKPKFTALPGDSSKTYVSSSHLGARPKKVPPPPPPRRSSRHTNLPGSSVSTLNGDMGTQSTQSMEDSMKKDSSDSNKEDNSVFKSVQETGTISKVNSHEIKIPVCQSSDITALSDSSEKLARFSKDLDLDLSGNGQQVDLTLIRETIINGPEEKASNETVPKETAVDDSEQKISKLLVGLDQKQRHNSFDSTSSSSSIDSQPEVVWLRRETETLPTSKTDNESMPGKKPRPPPPQRRSSLSEKSTYVSKKDQSEESSSFKQSSKDRGSKEKL